MRDGRPQSKAPQGLLGRLRPTWRAVAQRVVEVLVRAPGQLVRVATRALRGASSGAIRVHGDGMRQSPRAAGAPGGIGQEEKVEQTHSMEGVNETQRPVAIAEESATVEAALASGTEPAAPAADKSVAASEPVAAADGDSEVPARSDGETDAPARQARGDDEDLPADDADEAPDEVGEGEDGEAGTAGDDENLATLSERIDGILESLLLASGAPLTVRRMVEVIRGSNGKEVRSALGRLVEHYAGAQRGIHLVEVAGGWQFRTAPQNVHYVRVLLREKPARLGRAALETLSIIAYKQPVTRADIEAIRGVDADSALNTLMQRKLVKIAGRKEVVGRPLLYATTAEFLEVFGLKDLKELPTLKEIGPVAEPEDEADIEDEQLESVAAESADEGQDAADAGGHDDAAEATGTSDGGSNGAAEESPVRRAANGDDGPEEEEEDDDFDDEDDDDFDDEDDDDFDGELDDELDDEDEAFDDEDDEDEEDEED